jgi:mRNA interferase RelE/StbE
MYYLIAMRVELTTEAKADFKKLPATIQTRVVKVLERLRDWPNVSGAKPMRGELAGHFRIRTGDWRVLFYVKGDVVVVRIANRRDVYDD